MSDDKVISIAEARKEKPVEAPVLPLEVRDLLRSGLTGAVNSLQDMSIQSVLLAYEDKDGMHIIMHCTGDKHNSYAWLGMIEHIKDLLKRQFGAGA